MSSYLSNQAFTYTFGLANFHLTGLDPRMDLALRLLKSDLCTSVHVSLQLDFDTHNGTGAWVQLRARPRLDGLRGALPGRAQGGARAGQAGQDAAR